MVYPLAAFMLSASNHWQPHLWTDYKDVNDKLKNIPYLF